MYLLQEQSYVLTIRRRSDVYQALGPIKPALRAAATLHVVMVLSMASVLAVPVMAPAIAAETGLAPSLLGVYSFVMWGCGIAGSVLAAFCDKGTLNATSRKPSLRSR